MLAQIPNHQALGHNGQGHGSGDGQQGPTTSDAIAAIVASEGNMDLAAERLFGTAPINPSSPNWGKPHPKTRLTALLTADPQAFFELQRILRTLSLLQVFSTMRLAAVAVEGTLDRLDPEVRVKLYKNMLESLATLTDDHTSTVNANSTSLNVSLSESVIRSLPPEIRDALKVLNVAPPNGFGSDGAGALDEGPWSAGNPPPNAAAD